MRLLGIAAVLSGLEAVLPVIGYAWPVSDLVRAIVYFVIVAAALVARLVAQVEFKGE